MATKSKGASLDPSTHMGGGQIQNGDYDVIKVRTGSFDYAGQVPEGVPAIMVTYKNEDGEVEQPYKAGDNAHLVASEDGKRFEHPSGENAAIFKGGAASLWLGSLAKQGFKFSGDDVSQIEGIKVTLENVAAPTGRGGAKEGKVIPLVTKIVKGKGTAPATRPTAAATSSTPAPAAASNGNLESVATKAILQTLGSAPDNTISLKGLSVRCMKFAPGVKLNDLTKFITTDWLVAQAETVGWTFDGNTVSFPGLDAETLTALLEAV